MTMQMRRGGNAADGVVSTVNPDAGIANQSSFTLKRKHP